jgi:anaerobic dimethyl sulfoxide reductase subunit C (anchor subunit)
MNTQEWALIVFTILAQMAVGSFLVLGVVHFFARRQAGEAAADRLSDRALLGIGPVLVLAMIASLFHLGTPLNAPRAVANIATSWLSREVLFSVLFVVVGGVFALMQWRKMASATVRFVVAVVAAIIGLALLVSMSQVYMLDTQPAWNSWVTPLSFFTTAALLGLFAVGASYVVNYNWVRASDASCAEEQCILLRAALRGIAVAAIVFLGVELVTVPIYLAGLANQGPAAVETARLLTDDYLALLVLRLAFLFLGAGVLGFFLYQNAASPGREQIMGRLAYGAFILVLVASVVGRFLFYASHVKIGL